MRDFVVEVDYVEVGKGAATVHEAEEGYAEGPDVEGFAFDFLGVACACVCE